MNLLQSSTSETAVPSQPGDSAPKEDLGASIFEESQYCAVLASGKGNCSLAWKRLEDEMSIVPAGDVLIANSDAGRFVVDQRQEVEFLDYEMSVESFYIDRYAISNAAFASFVQAGGYDKRELWPDEIFPYVLQFLDQTGTPGPLTWKDGLPPKEKLNHPVVGVCWYEANAFALWAGKRLPTCAEWQRSGTWAGDGKELRFPWGDAFDPKKANLWQSAKNGTVPNDAYFDGATPNGIYQLTGNVWEWVGTLFECPESEGAKVVYEQPMAEARGGAFDTYFPMQATCQFRTGFSMLHRANNLGFRCCVSIGDIQNGTDPYAFLEDGSDV